MTRIAISIGLCSFLLLATPQSQAQTTQPATRPFPPGRVQALVDDLDSPNAARQAAVRKELAELPPAAVPYLENALRSALSRQNRVAVESAIVAIHNRPLRAAMVKKQSEDVRSQVLILRKGYRLSGHTNPKWDKLVEAFFDNLTTVQIPPKPADVARQNEVFAQILAAKCDDPYFRSMDLISKIARPSTDMNLPELRDACKTTLEEMQKSSYAADIKLHFSSMYLRFLLRYGKVLGGDALAEVHRANKICVELLPDVIKQYPKNSDGPWQSVVDTYEGLYAVDPAHSFSTVNDLLTKLAPDTFMPPMLAAVHYTKVNVRWSPDDVRGAQVANQKIAEATAIVRESSEAAWKRAPQYTLAASYAMNVAKDDEEFDLWYKRATDTNPDNYLAANTKLAYLLRNGRTEEALKFARACANHDLPLCEIIMLLPNYHYQVGTESGVPKPDYFEDRAIFQEIQDVYERYLAEYPENVGKRCEYARYALWAEQWNVANQQFTKLGEKYDPAIFQGKQQYDYSRRKAAENAKPNP